MRIMSAIVVGFVVLCSVIGLQGCGDIPLQMKHMASSAFGIKRVVVLYDANGGIIRRWEGNFKVEDNGGSANFVCDGKVVKIAGTYIVEEM